MAFTYNLQLTPYLLRVKGNLAVPSPLVKVRWANVQEAIVITLNNWKL